MPSHAETYLAQAAEICRRIDPAEVEAMVAALVALRARGGRLFILGVGRSAASCGHAVTDFRKLCGIQAYAPPDKLADLNVLNKHVGTLGAFARHASWSAANVHHPISGYSD